MSDVTMAEIISALEFIEKLATGPVGAAIGHLLSGVKGDVDSETMFARIVALDGTVQADDDKADAAADAK